MKGCARIGLCLALLFALSSCNPGGEGVADAGQPATAEQSAGAEAETREPTEAAQSAGTQATAAEARNLTERELRQWSKFLSQIDCYGFLMSSYATPLEADLGQVFYVGAGVGEYPAEEMVDDFLNENGFEEAYTDITFIPYDAANQVLERRTGYTLEHFKLAGNDIPMTYLPKYAGYFHMAGDTNQMAAECVSGRLNADGSVFLQSREKSWSDEPDADNSFVSTFETTLKPDPQNPDNMLFASNAVTGGWLSRAFDEDGLAG